MIIIDFAGAFGGIAFAVGAALWFGLIIFGGGIADRGVVASNFISSILFFIGAISSIKKLFTMNKNKYKIIAIVESVILIGLMIYGFSNHYNSLVLHYSYKGLASAIHTTWIAAAIINIINIRIISDELGTTIIGILAIIVFGFFIGQFITMGLFLFKGVDGTKNIYNNIMYYHNEQHNLRRDEFETPLEMANLALDKFKNDLVNNRKRCLWRNYLRLS